MTISVDTAAAIVNSIHDHTARAFAGAKLLGKRWHELIELTPIPDCPCCGAKRS